MRWIALAAVLAASPAFAYEIWWQRTTHYTDGAEISVSDTVQYVAEWSDDNFSTVLGSRTTTAAAMRLDEPPAGVVRCHVVRAVVAGVASGRSNVWCRGVAAPAPKIPNAPTALSGN